MAKKPLAKAAAEDTVSAPAEPEAPAAETTDAVQNQDDPSLFNGADPALFDHDGDGHAGGSLPKPDTDKPAPKAHVEPTVGRIVHFYENSAQEIPFAAIVTVVDSGGVKLTIFRPNITIPYSSYVPHLDDLTQDGPCWVWPLGTPQASASIANVGSLADRFPGATGATVFGHRK